MPAGRPRAFDKDQALERALMVFWKKGYEGASLPDLTAAMGINRPSLYAAFGNKESLFRQALDRYGQMRSCMQSFLEETKIARVFERMLVESAKALTHPETPPGCLMVSGALVCAEESETVRQELVSRRVAGELALRKRIKRAKDEGELAKDADPATLARYVSTVTQGMAVQAAGGANREQLVSVAKLALKALPV